MTSHVKRIHFKKRRWRVKKENSLKQASELDADITQILKWSYREFLKKSSRHRYHFESSRYLLREYNEPLHVNTVEKVYKMHIILVKHN